MTEMTETGEEATAVAAGGAEEGGGGKDYSEITAAPGEKLHQAEVAAFSMLAMEDPEKAFDEYGLTLMYSIHEAEAASFARSLGIEEGDSELLMAVAAHRKGKLDEAEKEYKRLASAKPPVGEAIYNLAVLSYQRGDREGAREYLERFTRYLEGMEKSRHRNECEGRAEALREEISE